MIKASLICHTVPETKKMNKKKKETKDRNQYTETNTFISEDMAMLKS